LGESQPVNNTGLRAIPVSGAPFLVASLGFATWFMKIQESIANVYRKTLLTPRPPPRAGISRIAAVAKQLSI
jgi:hypothetical protein